MDSNFQEVNDVKKLWNMTRSRVKSSLPAKLIMVGFITLILMIPLAMTSGVRSDRMRAADYAEDEVSKMWGGSQTVMGPVLTVPMERTKTRTLRDRSTVTDTETKIWCFSPETLQISSVVTPQIRVRGIYEVMLYNSTIEFSGKFMKPEIPNGWTPVWSEASIGAAVSDIKGVGEFKVLFNDQELTNCDGGVLKAVRPAALSKDFFQQGGDIKVSLTLKGCSRLHFQPLGKVFNMSITSDHPHPSFSGNFLPAEREISDSGFAAKWQINAMNRKLPQVFSGNIEAVNDDVCGVRLVKTANIYQQVERVSEYAVLLIGIVMVAFLLGEVVTKVWVHPLQYFFVGLSLVLFYMLLLALSEHLAFEISYAVTTLVITGMTTGYLAMIFQAKRKAAPVLGGIILLSYILIYVLIQMEDYALLTGSIILTVLMGVLMKFTGRINQVETEE